LVEEIRAYWHDQRLNNKSEGIRKLIEAGLAEWRKSKKAGDVRPRGKMTKWVRVSEER
jgi:hypothetical protein